MSAWTALRVLIVRMRFFLILLVVLTLVGSWPTLRHYGRRMFGSNAAVPRGLDDNMEFWCPMCPGVVSDWPGKCPVCNMALVRRKKGEATPRPDGALARMQLSPYRVQLAGIRTAVVEPRLLRREVVLVGVAERSAFTSAVSVRAEVFASDVPFLSEGQSVEAGCDELPGHVPFHGKIARIQAESGSAHRSIVVRLELDDPQRDLRAGSLLTARTEAPLARLAWWRRAVMEEGCKESAILGGVGSLVNEAGRQVMLAHGYGLAVPCAAVIDHGSRKVIFLESGPGMFDAVEIAVGPRCGDFYPVLRGVSAGQRVAAAGAFLLDAEMWLNHDLAATYFGATRGAASSPATPPPPPVSPSPTMEEDRLLAAKQKTCPVTGAPLDSMGGPVRVEMAGRVVFICCKGCEKALRSDPAKYLAKMQTK